MTQSFAELKKSSKSSLSKLQQDLAKLNPTRQKNEDEGEYWYPAVDKAGNGEATIRFLPAPAGEDVPFVRLWNHGFHGPAGKTGPWLIENCPTTIGKPCPICDHNTSLWNTGEKDARALVSAQKRKLTFIANVLVIKDKLNPENENKVFKFKFGKKLFDKLNEAMNPAFDDEEPLNPFDPWSGANFRVRIKNVEGYRNYDASKFDSPAALADSDEEIEAIWKQCYPLAPIVAPDQFKGSDELKAKLNRVLVLDTPVVASSPKKKVIDDEIPFDVTPKKPAPKATKAKMEEDDEDSLDAFKNLMDDED